MEQNIAGRRENPDQIPKDADSQSETGRLVSEQAGIQGQRKEVNVESYSKVAATGQILKDMDFPADKNKIVTFAKQQQNSTGQYNYSTQNIEEVLSGLQKLEDREYKNVSYVTTALGIVH